MKSSIIHTTLIVAGLVLGSCQKELPNQPLPNKRPVTRLWLASDNTLRETSSRQHLYWYGEDPDGTVSGYLISVLNYRLPGLVLPSPDTLSYFWTTRSDSLMPLPLLQARDSFTIVIRAIDNSFNGSTLPERAFVRMSPRPFWDVNANGLMDAGDVELPSVADGIDPTGAVSLFPLRNTPPTVSFLGDPNAADTTVPVQPPGYSFPCATFAWRGEDIDGNNTIAGYRIALNDTTSASSWLMLSSATTQITLLVTREVSDAAIGTVDADVYSGTYPSMQYRGKVSGLRLDNTNRLYLQAVDIAGEYSKAVRIPDSISVTNNRSWFVKKPRSRMLLVLDYGPTATSEKNSVVPYYRNIFSDPTIAGGSLADFDSLDIALQQPFFLNPALIKTLQLYDMVFWVTQKFPSIVPAQIGLFYYTQGGGKVIFSTTFATALSYADLHALNDFAPLDSTTSDAVNPGNNPPTNTDSRVNVKNNGAPMVVRSMMSGYPDLTVDSLTVSGSQTSAHTLNMRRIYKRTDSQYIYRLDSSRTNPPRYLGSPAVACIDNNKRFVMFALPLHILNGVPKNLPLFFKQVIENEFNIH